MRILHKKFPGLIPWIPLIIGICPILVFHTTHFLSAQAGNVPWCIPYWQSCTSISATGREGVAFVVFKLTMLPAALLLYWYWCIAWQKLQGANPGGYPLQPRLHWLGTISAIFLAVYTLALGLESDGFQLLRRIGIIIFFAFTFLGQLLFTWQLGQLPHQDRTRPLQLMLCSIVLLAGLLTLFLDAWLENYDDYEDAFEWTIALLLQAYFVVSYWTWKGLDSRLAMTPSALVEPGVNRSGIP